VKLRWLRSGSVSLRRHVNFIAAENPAAAARVRRRIRSVVLRLVDFPESGRVGQVPGTRELIIGNLPYIVLYRVSGDVVEILRVFHSSQDRANLLH
jgi:plasmid stabilization system protein ParE